MIRTSPDRRPELRLVTPTGIGVDPLPDGSFNATVFADSKIRQGTTKIDLDNLYRALLSESKLLRSCLKGRLGNPVNACDASSYIIGTAIDRRSMRVGEASLSIDPLSSQGVQVAISSAIQGAVAVHTILTRPEDRAAAMSYYQSRLTDTALSHQYFAAKVYQSNPNSSSFWSRRQFSLLKDQPLVKQAKSISALVANCRIRLAPSAKIVDVPVIEGDFVVHRPALVHSSLVRPVSFLGNHSIAPLVTILRQNLTPRGNPEILGNRNADP